MTGKIFVAGGSGVLGRASLQPLVEAGYKVRSTARGRDKADLVRRLGAEPVECDLYDPASVQRAMSGCDVVIRLTTKIGSVMKIRDPRAWDETNRLRTTGARILVDAAIATGVPVYLHESVTFVYADGGSNWLHEDSAVDDNSQVMRSTLEGEQEVARFTQTGGRGVVLRFAAFLRPRCSFYGRDDFLSAQTHAESDRSSRKLLLLNLRSRCWSCRNCGGECSSRHL